jgi:phosphopantothenoylcysteine decarboxylase/phosphopantothenate--cysteine ligase
MIEFDMPKKQSHLKHLNVLLGVTGGIAAYKAVGLASRLTVAGAKVKTVMTENACRLVGPESFGAVTHSAVFTSLWSSSEDYEVGHIALAEWADMVVVVPATANMIGKVANGICDDLLSSVLCACWAAPILLAPAMNDNMWNNPAVQRNVKVVKQMGFRLIGPEKGRLACGTEAIGRMSEPQDILQAIEKIASQIKRKKK